jgi:hypothetical protein
MKKVDIDTAKDDFDRFILALGIKPKKLDKLEEEADEIIKGIEYGNVIIDDNGTISYILDDPIKFDDNSNALDKVTFAKRRITLGEMEKKMIGKTDLEKTRRMFAYLTSTNSGFLLKMSGDDFFAISQIAAFFLPR